MHAPLPSPARLALTPDGGIEGYASLFGVADQARDVVMPGAFTQTLRTRGLRRVPMLFQHDPALVVGIWLELREDLRGLYARGRLIPDVARGRELLALLRNGAIDGLSIGYRTVRGRIDPRSRVRRLYEVDLWEISIVTFPLLDGARVHAVKTSEKRLAAEAAWASVSGAVRTSRDALDVTPPLTRPRPRALPPPHLADRAARKAALRHVARSLRA